MVRARVARATDGAAPKRPAKLLGLKTVPSTAKAETKSPPTRKRKSSWSMRRLRWRLGSRGLRQPYCTNFWDCYMCYWGFVAGLRDTGDGIDRGQIIFWG